MSANCSFQGTNGCVGGQSEVLDVQGVELEPIMVRTVSGRRARRAVARLAEIVGDLGPDMLVAADRARGCRNVVHAPVAERPAWRIGIVDDERKALSSRRRI